MSGIGALGASGGVLLNLGHAEAAQKTAVTRLSSGLRINSAADDPSGLAISQKLHAQAAAYDAAVGNVQTASNALAVADGALKTTTDILQRIRSLAVAAASDLQSAGDRTDTQAEITQLLGEVNRIAQNTNFNGVALLDGTHAGPVAGKPASITIESNAALSGAVLASASASSPALVDGDFSSPNIGAGNVSAAPPTGWAFTPSIIFGAPILVNGGGVNGGYNLPIPSDGSQAVFLPTLTTVSQAFATLAAGTYTLTLQAANDLGALPFLAGVGVELDGTQIGPLQYTGSGFAGYSFTFTVATTGPHVIGLGADGTSGFGLVGVADVALSGGFTNTALIGSSAGLLVATAVAANANFQTTAGGTAGLGGAGTSDGSIEVQVVNTGASIAVQESFYDTATHLTSVSSALLAPGSTSSLFDNVQLTLGAFGAQDVGMTAYLRIGQNGATKNRGSALAVHEASAEGDITLVALPEASTDALRISAASVATTIAASDTVGAIDGALTILEEARSALGAQIQALGDAASSGDISSSNLTAAASTIADANVASESTTLAKAQITTQVGVSLIASLNAQALNILKLVIG